MPEISIKEVIKKVKANNGSSDSKLIQKAYLYAEKKHGGQVRLSGDPYVKHPLEVAYILSDLELDDSSICAALLHDVIEDTDATHEEMVENFRRRNCRNSRRGNKTWKNTIFYYRRATSRKL